MNDFWKVQNPEVGFSQKEAQHNNKQIPTEIWREFVDNTTLHGIRCLHEAPHSHSPTLACVTVDLG